MKRKLTSILLMSALLVGGASTFVSCKDYDGDQAAVQNANLAKLQEIVKANKDALDEAIAGKQDQLPQDVLTNLNQLGTAIANAQTAADWVNTYGELSVLKDQLTAISAVLGYQDLLAKLDAATEDWEWPENLSELVQRTELLNYVTQEEFQTEIAKRLSKEEFQTEIAKYVTLEQLQPYLEMLNSYQTKEALEADVKKIMNDWTNGLAENFTSYEDFVQQMDKVPAELQAIKEALAGLESKLNIVNNKVAKLVTGINVDMISNPFWGTLNTPFGIKSTVLVGYVGGEIDNDKAASFGAEEGGLAQSATGGSIFLTLNPNDIEAEGMNFALVGRDGEEAPGYELASLVKDNSKVTTVTTRAAAVNGYKADFKLTDGKAAMVNVDKAALKDVASNVLGKLKGKEALDITSAVQTIYSTFANAVDQYYALQAAWEETQLDGTKKTRAVVSDYNIAAVTVKPLGYNSLNAVDSKLDNYNIPQIPLLQDWLNANITDITYSKINPNDIEDVTVKIENAKDVKVEYTGQDEDGKVTFTPETGTGKITMDFSKITVTGETLEVKVSLKQLRDVVENLNKQVGDMVDNVNGLFDKAEDLAGRADTYISKVNKVLSVANKFIHKLPQFLQPVVVAVGSNGAVRLSEVDGAYTQFTGAGSLVLVPTSYTAELLAPSFKKSIKVDNGKELVADCDGTVKTLSVELAKGKHTISYRTMDYYGTIVEKKYYVEVK